MAKKKSTSKKRTTTKTPSTRKKSTRKKSSTRGSRNPDPAAAAGKRLVIVESPAKAKTIGRYLGPDYVVYASVGHVRDLPAKAPKGEKQPVPGVDIENHFAPTYEVLSDKKKTVTELKKAAKVASEIWFATDLDREGEAISWHLAQILGIPADDARRVIFNAITADAIRAAFDDPHPIHTGKVNAQQARRILDRIVGYQVSPLLWKKVARGLSAGRVQSVAVRVVVEREREIRAFIPDENWKVTGLFTTDLAAGSALADAWNAFASETDDKGNTPTIRAQNAWLADRAGIRAELVELGGKKFDLGAKADDPRDLTDRVKDVAAATGLIDVQSTVEEDAKGKGPAQFIRTVTGSVDPAARYAVKSIETKRTSTRPPAPFITSTLQMSASTSLSFSTDRTMRVAQGLYEGVNIPGEGQTGLITYMRTDSTHLSGEAVKGVREFIGQRLGKEYLPEKPKFYSSSNKDAQEAHEAIRPTDVRRHPDELRNTLSDDQYKLYRLIWNRFLACQMKPAQWDSTTILFERTDQDTGAVFKTTGRVLVFDGFYRVTGVPTSSDEQTLPELAERDPLAPFAIEPEQKFTSPPPRYSEASLVKALESEGIGRPSTYASIIKVIQDRNYVEQVNRRFHATDLGEVVTDKLIQGFPKIMDVGYTRLMEAELDKIEDQNADWVAMLEAFYKRFSEALDTAMETMTHAKAEIQPAPYQCPTCGARTAYRFGKNGRFLSCGAYPDCDYAAPIDREGRPLLPERVNVACPEDGSQMIARTGRFGKFLASVNYPDIKFVLNLDKKGNIKLPSPPALKVEELECPKCESPMHLRNGKRGPWLGCSTFPKCRGRLAWTKLEDDVKERLEKELEAHEKANPQPVIRTLDGEIIPDGTPLEELLLPGGVQELAIHPDAVEQKKSA